MQERRVELTDFQGGRLVEFLRRVGEGDLVRFDLDDHSKSRRPYFVCSYENGLTLSDEQIGENLRIVQSVTGYFTSQVSSPRIVVNAGDFLKNMKINEFFSVTPFDISSNSERDSAGAIRVPVRLIQKYEILSDVAANPGELLDRGYLNGIHPHNLDYRRRRGGLVFEIEAPA